MMKREKEERYLRDTLVLLQECIPSKRRRMGMEVTDGEDGAGGVADKAHVEAVTGGEGSDGDAEADATSDDIQSQRNEHVEHVGREIIQEKRKTCLKELIPVLFTGPFARNDGLGGSLLSATEGDANDALKVDTGSTKDNADGLEKKDDDVEEMEVEKTDTGADADGDGNAVSKMEELVPDDKKEEMKTEPSSLSVPKESDSTPTSEKEGTGSKNIIHDDATVEKSIEAKQDTASTTPITPSTTTPPTTTTTTISESKDKKEETDDSNTKSSRPLDYYQSILKSLKTQNETFTKTRHDVFANYAHLLASYEYGLKHVKQLNDLSHAPDNILEGNFPPPPPSSYSGKKSEGGQGGDQAVTAMGTKSSQ